MSSGCEVSPFSTATDVPAANQVTVKTLGGELFQVDLVLINAPEPVIQEDPATRERILFNLNDAEKAFYDMPVEQISELLAAANYLNIKTLYLYGCQTLAALIKGKSPEEIRELLGLEDDMTEEEKDSIRKKNVWCTF